MAANLKPSADDDLPEISDINVTPFIDVMLVLLITFMIAAPLSTVDIAVDLPVSNAQAHPRPDRPVFLTMRSDLRLALGDLVIPRERLQVELDERTGRDRAQRVFLRADRAVAYGDIMTLMNLMRDSGYLKIALVGLEDAGQTAGEPPGAAPASPP